MQLYVNGVEQELISHSFPHGVPGHLTFVFASHLFDNK